MLFERVGAVLADKYKLYYTCVFIEYGFTKIFNVKFKTKKLIFFGIAKSWKKVFRFRLSQHSQHSDW